MMFAGRNISVTHAALSSTRVMATCALLGQAMGMGAALALKYGCAPRGVYEGHIAELQKNLLRDGSYLPNTPRMPSELTLSAKLNISETEREALFSGIERPRTYDGENEIFQNVGESLVFEFDKSENIGTLRLHFDPDYSRESITPNRKMRIFAMKLHTGKDFVPVKTAATIAKAFAVFADGKEVYRAEDNYLSLVKIPLDLEAKQIKVEWLHSNGGEKVGLFAADFI